MDEKCGFHYLPDYRMCKYIHVMDVIRWINIAKNIAIKRGIFLLKLNGKEKEKGKEKGMSWKFANPFMD